MEELKKNLVTWLFETDAVRVCPKDAPFWYTSGSIGPFYINTHFLYGNQDKANDLLKIIDDEVSYKPACPDKILKITKNNYSQDLIYSKLIDGIVQYIKQILDLNNIDYISGGERRDWFFSLIVADLLKKPHISIFKDLSAFVTSGNVTTPVQKLDGARILHIADLLNEASSYERAWIPAISTLGGSIDWSLVVVDRNQGGSQLLENAKVQSLSMIDIDAKLFEKAYQLGLISEEQRNMVAEYIINPKESMRKFLIENPAFIESSLNAESKTAQRARMCIEKDIYHLKNI